MDAYDQLTRNATTPLVTVVRSIGEGQSLLARWRNGRRVFFYEQRGSPYPSIDDFFDLEEYHVSANVRHSALVKDYALIVNALP